MRTCLSISRLPTTIQNKQSIIDTWRGSVRIMLVTHPLSRRQLVQILSGGKIRPRSPPHHQSPVSVFCTVSTITASRQLSFAVGSKSESSTTPYKISLAPKARKRAWFSGSIAQAAIALAPIETVWELDFSATTWHIVLSTTLTEKQARETVRI